MELTLEQIKEITVGALNVFRDDQGYHFRRFTERQVDVLFADNDQWGRDHDTTGVRLDLHTDATQLTVSVVSGTKFEILINDLTAYWERPDTPARFSVALDGLDNRVTILLPSHSEGVIQSIFLGDATYVRPHTHSVKLAFYGDSITQGWNSEKDSQSYAWLTTRYFDADSMNFGVGGTVFIPDLPEATAFEPDAVIVALGTNDYGRNKPMAQIENDCTAYLKNIANIYSDSKLFCITPIWRGIGTAVKAAGTLNDVRQAIADIACALGFIVIDGLTMVPHRLEYYADKGTHPNDLGFAVYAQNLIKALSPHL